MWFDQASGESWGSLWSGYVLCVGDCHGIRAIDASCPACGAGPLDTSPEAMTVNGRTRMIGHAFAGAEGRYEDYVYLEMLQREWERPAVEFERFSHFADAKRPSARVALVLLFWSYFETRIERLHRTAMRALPQRVLDDALRRHQGIHSRLYELYKIFFGVSYFDDLRNQGYYEVAKLLENIHKCRNEFSHGKPQSINDELVNYLVENLKAEHDSWITVYNSRV